MIKNKDFYKGHRSRIREKFIQTAADNFQDYEILEMLLFLANPRIDTKPMAKDLLDQLQNLENIIKASPLILKKFNQISDAAIFLFKLINEVNNRINRSKAKLGNIFQFNEDFLESYRLKLKNLSKESLILLFLNEKKFIIGEKIINDGSLEQINISKKKIIEYAVALSCESLILMHNHPNASAKPSKYDINSTNIISEALRLIDIELYDHIIFGVNDMLSFKEGGLL